MEQINKLHVYAFDYYEEKETLQINIKINFLWFFMEDFIIYHSNQV